MLNLRLPRRLRDPFTALLLFGAAGILAMIVAFAITALPRLGGSPGSPTTNAQTSQPASSAEPTPSESPPGPDHGHGHRKGG